MESFPREVMIGAIGLTSGALNGSRNRNSVVAQGRYYYFDDGSRIRVGQSQSAPEFGDTLTHPADSHANTIWSQLNYLLVDAFAVVPNRNHDICIVPGYGYATVSGS